MLVRHDHRIGPGIRDGPLMLRWIAIAAMLCCFSACSGAQPSVAIAQQVADASADVRAELSDASGDLQAAAAAQVIPASIEAAEVVQELLPPAPSTPEVARSPMTPAGMEMLVRHEITSEAYYVRRLQGVACPGGMSGPTRGIGWDDGTHTRGEISAAWHMHPQLPRILPASGQMGRVKCHRFRDANRDIVTPLDMAQQVFHTDTLPSYRDLAAMTFADGWDRLPPHAQDALVMTVYNRGSGMAGERRREMRVLRDTCVPAADVACMAAQFRSMPRLWAGSSIAAGMTSRYRDTAMLAEGGVQ